MQQLQHHNDISDNMLQTPVVQKETDKKVPGGCCLNTIATMQTPERLQPQPNTLPTNPLCSATATPLPPYLPTRPHIV